MVKRTLIAVAVVALLATMANAAVQNPYKEDASWPGTWTFTPDKIELCQMKVYMDVGIYVQLKECDKKKIEMKQVDCPSGKNFPCYNGCETFDLRANYNVKLQTKLDKVGPVINKWSAYYDGGDTYLVADNPGGAWKNFKVCVEASESNIWTVQPGDKVEVGKLTILVIPN